jgi:hypothetical protein
MNNKINFSHDYHKLWGQKKAELVCVKKILAPVYSTLREYDTRTTAGTYYELPQSGILLHLTFIGDQGIPFCTLRRHTIEKERYYRNMIGQDFDIQVYRKDFGRCTWDYKEQQTKRCPECDGTGDWDQEGKWICQRCKGHGQVTP